MLGIDGECFYATGWSDIPGTLTVEPALSIFRRQSAVKMKKVHKPIAVDIAPNGYPSLELALPDSKITEDGLAAEFPVTPGSAADIMAHMREAITVAHKIANSTGTTLVSPPYVTFSPKWLANQPELRVLGCNPDQSVYDAGAGMMKPAQDPREITWRTGGAHVHFSVPGLDHKGDFMSVQSLVLLCDLFLGTLDVVLEHSDLGLRRREMYGQPGKFRIQEWGVEYRTPSNVWMTTPQVSNVFLSVAELVHNGFESGVLNGLAMSCEIDFQNVVNSIVGCRRQHAMTNFNWAVSYARDRGLRLSEDVVGVIHTLYNNGGLVKYIADYNMSAWLQ